MSAGFQNCCFHVHNTGLIRWKGLVENGIKGMGIVFMHARTNKNSWHCISAELNVILIIILCDSNAQEMGVVALSQWHNTWSQTNWGMQDSPTGHKNTISIISFYLCHHVGHVTAKRIPHCEFQNQYSSSWREEQPEFGRKSIWLGRGISQNDVVHLTSARQHCLTSMTLSLTLLTLSRTMG